MRITFLIALSTLLCFTAELLEPSSPFVRLALPVKKVSAKWVSLYRKQALEMKVKNWTSEQRKSLAKFLSQGHDAQPQGRMSVIMRQPVVRLAHEPVSFYQPPQLSTLVRPPSA